MADPAINAEDLATLLKSCAPPGSQVQVTKFPSGALDVEVRRADGPVVIMQGLADGSEYGLTPDLRAEEHTGFDQGHPQVFSDYDSARKALIDLVCQPAGA